MLKSNAIDRLLRENPELKDRRYGLPDIGRRLDGEYSIQPFKILLML